MRRGAPGGKVEPQLAAFLFVERAERADAGGVSHGLFCRERALEGWGRVLGGPAKKRPLGGEQFGAKDEFLGRPVICLKVDDPAFRRCRGQPALDKQAGIVGDEGQPRHFVGEIEWETHRFAVRHVPEPDLAAPT